MSQPPLDLTPIGTNTTNEKISHLDSTPIGKKKPYPKPVTWTTELPKHKGKPGKEYVLEEPDSDLLSSDLSSSESDSSNDSKYRKFEIKNRNKKEKRLNSCKKLMENSVRYKVIYSLKWHHRNILKTEIYKSTYISTWNKWHWVWSIGYTEIVHW